MAILANDIKLLESERMSDATDGGGRRTSRIIPDGVTGNIFPKVSRLDSVYGRVNLRKVYGAVQTAGVDTYAGAHAVITDAPDNERIHCTLFSTASEHDTRTAARDRIESYVTTGPESRMILMGRQLIGQQQIVAYQRVEEPLPEVGQVYCLTNESGGTITTQQYFRAQSVEHEDRQFSEMVGASYVTFTRRVVTVGTGVPLRHDFNGPENIVQNSNVARSSRIRTTTVVDAARYFGIQPVTVPVAQNDLTVKVRSVYSAIVPTTNRETPLSNVALPLVRNLAAAKATTISDTAASTWANGAIRFTRRPILPGTLTITGSGVTAVTDNKMGIISNATFQGEVDYESGQITRTGGSATASSYTMTYRPAGVAAQTAHTLDNLVTIGNRGTVYVFTLNPIPSPGSAFVDYRALGKWYRLRDNGDGVMAGDDPAYGVGTLNYATGALVLTLGALPDVGSSVLIGFGSVQHYAVRADGTADAGGSVKQIIQLPDTPIVSDSLSLTYTSGGVQYTATDNASGVITGNGVTGRISYGDGIVDLEYTVRLPDFNTMVACGYQQVVPVAPENVVQRSMSAGASSSFSLGTGVVPGSFIGSVPFAGGAINGPITIVDNGSGLLVAKGGQVIRTTDTAAAKDARIAGDQTIGTINYSTGACVINQGVVASANTYTKTGFDGHWFNPAIGRNVGRFRGDWSATDVNLGRADGTANYGWKDSDVTAAQSGKTFEASFLIAPLVVDLARTIVERYVPGSVMFTVGGKTYIDRNGALYMDVSSINGSGTLAGSFDYATGQAGLTNWTNGAAPGLAVNAGLTVFGSYTAENVFIRTSGSPIRPGSFHIQATGDDGTLISATAAESGAINGTQISGSINQETGIVRLAFGVMVAAAGNEAAWWYRVEDVVGGQIWQPYPVIAVTASYNGVVLANLPLNADLLGLDPVRLPMDGRVPIYRPADVAVLHNTAEYAIPHNPPQANQTYNVGRTDVAEMWLTDSTGRKLHRATCSPTRRPATSRSESRRPAKRNGACASCGRTGTAHGRGRRGPSSLPTRRPRRPSALTGAGTPRGWPQRARTRQSVRRGLQRTSATPDAWRNGASSATRSSSTGSLGGRRPRSVTTTPTRTGSATKSSSTKANSTRGTGPSPTTRCASPRGAA